MKKLSECSSRPENTAQALNPLVVQIQHMMEKYNINHTTLRIIGLYARDYRSSFHLREIAGEIGVDVKAVQVQLKRLERINVLSSTFKGRNKEYSLNLDNLITKYYMILAETFVSINHVARDFLIKKIMNEIGDRMDGVIVLFGSFAKGEADAKSDVDLLVLVEKKLETDIFKEVGDLVGRNLSVKVSSSRKFLEGLNNRDPLMMEVASNHVVLKGVDDFCDVMWRYHAKR